MALTLALTTYYPSLRQRLHVVGCGHEERARRGWKRGGMTEVEEVTGGDLRRVIGDRDVGKCNCIDALLGIFSS